jgi:uroporphyrinogen-III synthase
MKVTKSLYLGIDPDRYGVGKVTHCPLIQIQKREVLKHYLDEAHLYTHCLISSRSTVPLLPFSLEGKTVIAVGKATASLLKGALVAPFAQQEGMITLLKQMDLEKAYVVILGSSGARGAILDYLGRRGVRHQSIILYDVVEREVELPDLSLFDEIVFTSPSVVEAFFKKGKITTQKVVAIGDVTKEKLRTLMH